MKKRIGILMFAVFLAAACAYAWVHRVDFKSMLSLNPWGIAALVSLNVLTRILIGLRLKYVTAPFDVKLSVFEGTSLSFVQSYGNVVAVKGGTAGLAYYLYARKGFSIDRFLVIVGGGFIVTALVSSLAGLVGVGIVTITSNVAPEIPLLFSAVLISAIMPIIIPRLKLSFLKFPGFIGKMVEGWELLSKGGNIVRLASIEVLVLIAFAFRYYAAFRIFGKAITLPKAFLLAPPAYLSLMLNVTPAGMGVREAILSYMSEVMGYTLKVGLGAVALDSIIMVAISLIIGPIAAYKLMPRGEKKDADA